MSLNRLSQFRGQVHIYRGPLNEFLDRIAKTPDFHAVVLLTQRQEEDGTREECALRFFAYLHRYTRFDHSVVDFLNGYMKEASGSFDYDANERIFLSTFQQLARLIPHGIVRKASRRITPINLYEAVAVGAALAIRAQSKIIGRGISTWIGSDELRKMTTGATNNRSTVVGRIEFCRDRFLGK